MGVKKNAFLRRWTRLGDAGISHAATAADGAVAHAVDGDAERVAKTPTSTTSVPYIPWRTTEDVEAEGATALTASDVAGELTLSDYRFLSPRRKI